MDRELENKALVLDLVEWVAAGERTYTEVMDAWRTSCPRLQIWEEATDLGLVVCERGRDSQTMVSVTAAGQAFLEAERPGSVNPTRRPGSAASMPR